MPQPTPTINGRPASPIGTTPPVQGIVPHGNGNRVSQKNDRKRRFWITSHRLISNALAGVFLGVAIAGAAPAVAGWLAHGIASAEAMVWAAVIGLPSITASTSLVLNSLGFRPITFLASTALTATLAINAMSNSANRHTIKPLPQKHSLEQSFNKNAAKPDPAKTDNTYQLKLNNAKPSMG